MRNTAYFDGGIRKKSNLAACAFVLHTEAVEIQVAKLIPVATNNVSEYSGLLATLRLAVGMGLQQLDVYSDSKLVVEQIACRWIVNQEHLFDLWVEAQQLISQIPDFSLTHVPRELNTHADALVNEMMDKEKEKEPHGRVSVGSVVGGVLPQPAQTPISQSGTTTT